MGSIPNALKDNCVGGSKSTQGPGRRNTVKAANEEHTLSQVFFISDLHLSHKRVIEFHEQFRAKCMGVSTIAEHDEMIYDSWNDTVSKRDVIYVLGDVGYDLSRIKQLPGYKKLLLGNHDELHAREYLEIFDDIIGPIKYKHHWLSHFPVHDKELYARPVCHGHTHSTGLNDSRYVNVCVEMTGGKPINYQDIVSGKFATWNRVNYPYGTVDNSIDHNPDSTKADSND
jgi:calcineurin-like phosphoesterase family protein